jgi:hypothetical protein
MTFPVVLGFQLVIIYAYFGTEVSFILHFYNKLYKTFMDNDF